MAVTSAAIAGTASHSTGPSGVSPPPDVVTAVQELLGQLKVAPEPPERVGYSRERFRHWSDADGDGCDAREEVLLAERQAGDVEDCAVLGGRWFSIYDGVTISEPGRLDIDHVVALGEAWDSGAALWSEERRAAYANDLGYRDALIAVTASSNRQKGDDDPAEWRPARQASWCRYATAWTTVKVRWGLTADSTETAAVREMFARCRRPPQTIVAAAT